PYKTTTRNSTPVLQKEDIAHLKHFVIVTALYELTQIIINNGDILLVKHFFDTRSAGLYSSMALIGRAVYFVAWMFVMLLLPEVVKLQKEGKDTKKLFFKYLGMIAALTTGVVIVNLLFPKLIVSILFGDAYLEIAPLLWKYALASSLFALANVFVYYFLSLDKYLPVLLSGVFGLAQLAAIVLWHSSLEQVVLVQVAIMCSLLLFQGLYFLYQVKSSAHRNQSPTRRRS
ncbi:MAG: oligosaccharide flippase family protein, partial [Leeuwenhoekiella sp.]